MGELPVSGAVADGVDVRNGCAATLVGRNADTAVVLDPDRLQPEPLDDRATPRRDEHEVALDDLAFAEVDAQGLAGLLDLRALRPEVNGDPPPLELLQELRGCVFVLLRDERREHLDDRHLRGEALEDRGELAADDAAAEDDEPAWHLALRQEARRVDAARRVDPFDRRAKRKRAGGDDRAPEDDVLPALDGDRVRVPEAPFPLDPLDSVRLEEARDAVRHLLDDGRLPLVRRREVELGRPDPDAESREGLLGLLEGERRLHPGLRRDAADAEAGAAERRLLLDAHGRSAELRGANRRRVPARPAAEDGDVAFHLAFPLGRVSARS